MYTASIPVAVDPSFDVLRVSEVAEEDVRKRAQQLLDDQVKRIEAGEGTVAQTHLRMGGPNEEIVTLGEEIDASLVVMGSRGLGGIRRALLGSVSSSVVQHAHCPVLVVRKEEPEEEVQVGEAGPEEVGLV